MAKKNESFEIMIKKLEDIVEVMNKGQLNLEDSIKNYEEGIKLCNKLFKTLNEYEGKIKILSEGKEKDFVDSEE
ncbi:Exodeoxyribonuclease VII small subunit [Clostridium sp. USBA 49]|jgi:exodeoxyribonuclease VII small subunit|uniref:exodeoxyribonuclease VII small subunit n=1 Tax=Clostridium TaxID=1485 RepID=UPI00099947CF|nr:MULTISPECIES: exodeoxyribonuclease VII small subunit [Clostridium]SKA76773.1 Exodeoxyribonuclease VII small subunit [Clostridium sp. USBA 49]